MSKTTQDRKLYPNLYDYDSELDVVKESKKDILAGPTLIFEYLEGLSVTFYIDSNHKVKYYVEDLVSPNNIPDELKKYAFNLSPNNFLKGCVYTGVFVLNNNLNNYYTGAKGKFFITNIYNGNELKYLPPTSEVSTHFIGNSTDTFICPSFGVFRDITEEQLHQLLERKSFIGDNKVKSIILKNYNVKTRFGTPVFLNVKQIKGLKENE